MEIARRESFAVSIAPLGAVIGCLLGTYIVPFLLSYIAGWNWKEEYNVRGKRSDGDCSNPVNDGNLCQRRYWPTLWRHRSRNIFIFRSSLL